MGLFGDPLFRALVEALEDCVLAVDTSGTILDLHCLRPELLPVATAGYQGQRLDKLFPPEVGGAFRLALQTLLKSGVAQTVSYSLTIDQERRHFSARVARPLVGDQPQDILVVIRDVTYQALTHQSMLESEAFYRLLAEHASDVVTVLNLDGEILYVSPSVERLAGFSIDEVLGHRGAEFVHTEDLARLGQLSTRGPQLPPPEGIRTRFRLRHKDGHWIWVEEESKPVEWQGRPAVLNSSRDITLRAQAEAELEEARRRAEAANRAKSAFLAVVSHDLRTPLHGLLGMSELLEQTHLSAEQQEYISAIRDSGNTLLARLNDLLDLSKIESGRLDLQAVDFDLVEAVEGLADLLGNQAAHKGLELICRVPPDVPTQVRGDPQRLRQMLINLIENALKFTVRGEVAVDVARTGEERLRFSVRDTGVGMKPAQVDQILGRGESVELGVSRGRGGPGLGLTLVRQLVALMGGELQVTSAEGRGTTFSFALPLPSCAQPQSTPQLRHLEGKRVLATDENATNRQLIQEILEQAGAEVELTSGGVETIRNLLDDPVYDCVILNASLPDLDGLATAEMIRSNRMLERLPLVLMISSADPEEVQRSKRLRVNAVLTKPIRRDTLVRAVHEVITSGGFREDLPSQEGTVLVVEDDAVNMRLARDILQRAGYAVVGARDGLEALRQLTHHAIDVVLMDIELPDMDGLEATARIRGTPSWAQIPIIAMTAHGMKGDAEHFLKAGVDHCLVKPVDRLELLGSVQRELARRCR